MSLLWATCYRGVSQAVEFGPSNQTQALARNLLWLRCQAGLGVNFHTATCCTEPTARNARMRTLHLLRSQLVSVSFWLLSTGT